MRHYHVSDEVENESAARQNLALDNSRAQEHFLSNIAGAILILHELGQYNLTLRVVRKIANQPTAILETENTQGAR